MEPPSSFDLVARAFHRNDGHRMGLRVICLLGLAVICLTFDDVGRHRMALAAALVATIPVPLLIHRHLDGRPQLLAHSWFDVLATGSLVWLTPDQWFAALAIIIGAPAASASIAGKRQYLATESVGLGLMALAAIGSGVDGWLVTWTVSLLLMPLIASYVEVFLTYERTASSHLTDLLESSSVMVWEVDAASGRVLSAAGRVSELLGWAPGQSLGSDVRDIIHPDDLEHMGSLTRLAVGESTIHQGRFRHRDGHYVWLRIHARAIDEPGRRLLRGVAIEITELVDAHDQMRRRAEIDELTGLANRSAFLADVQQRLREQRRCALLLLDLDRFKQVNDTLGHQTGDLLLQEIGRRLAALNPEPARVARLGGDEFAVLFDIEAGLDEIHDAVRRMSKACEQPMTLDGMELTGSASIGVVLTPEHGIDAATLLRRADVAMYAAKRERRPHHVFDFTRDEQVVQRLSLINEIEAALANQELRLWFQPKIDLNTGATIGAEGLLRWHHPKRGVLTPDQFLEATEMSRHLRSLTEHVLDQGIAFARRCADMGRPIDIAVNVSVRNLLEPDFTERLAAALRRHGVDPAQLIIEVTERDIMDDRSLSRVDAATIRQLGVGLSVDDFGTGHSSLVRIQQLPVSEIKIDRRFVSGLGRDPSSPILIRSIIDLGRNLGHTIVAEGVERELEADLLRGMGCPVAQGHLYSPTVPADQFIATLGHDWPAPVA